MKQSNPRSAKPSSEADRAAVGDVTSQSSPPTPAKISPAAPERPNNQSKSPGREPEQKPEPKALEQLIPPILFEGDQPEPKSVGSSEKFGPVVSSEPPQREAGVGGLPQSYGTNRLLLTARDPQSLYAHWDAPLQAEDSQAGPAGHRQLLLRIHRESLAGPVIKEIGMHPDSRHCFVEIDDACGIYVAELGRQLSNGSWTSITASEPAVAPIQSPAQQSPVLFATLTFGAPVEPAMAIAQAQIAAAPIPASDVDEPAVAMRELERQFPLPPPLSPLSPQEHGLQPEFVETIGQYQWPEELAIDHLIAPGQEPLSRFLTSAPTGSWTPSQERALAALIGQNLLPKSRLESSESTRTTTVVNSSLLLQTQTAVKLPFWLNVNAELIIYGATEPDATVLVGGEEIRVRTDGTFSCRFALPDGSYRLAVSATSAHGDRRQAEFDFSRSTDYSVQAGAHPQSPGLKTPPAGF